MKKIGVFIDKWGFRVVFPLILIMFLKTCTTNTRIEKLNKDLVIKTQKLSKEDYSLLFDVHTSSKYTQITKSILKYRLKNRFNRGSFSSNNSLKEVLSVFASDESTFIKNTNTAKVEIGKFIFS